MLIAKIFMNGEQIDEIRVQNVRKWHANHDLYDYRIRTPWGHDEQVFTHVRKDGYEPLLARVLMYLFEKKMGKVKG